MSENREGAQNPQFWGNSEFRLCLTQAHERFHDDALYKSTFYLLTFFTYNVNLGHVNPYAKRESTRSAAYWPKFTDDQ